MFTYIHVYTIHMYLSTNRLFNGDIVLHSCNTLTLEEEENQKKIPIQRNVSKNYLKMLTKELNDTHTHTHTKLFLNI